MNPGDADWWWQYGLDGIVAGLISAILTALVTAGAVLWTLRHEQERAHHQALDSECLRLRQVARQLSQFAQGGQDTEYTLAWWDFNKDANDFMAAAHHTGATPKFTELFETTLREIGKNGATSANGGVKDRQKLLANLQNAEKLLSRRVYWPAYFEQKKGFIDSSKKAIEDGWSLG